MTRPFVRTGALTVVIAAVLSCQSGGSSAGVELEAEAEKLRALHERVLEAHRTGNVDDWMAIGADPYVSANGGRITFPTASERRAARTPYLQSTTFTAYRDIQPPVVRVSADGTLGWVIAEVEVRGTRVSEGVETPIDAIWAWIELYEKRDGEWRIIGNVSNRRP